MDKEKEKHREKGKGYRFRKKGKGKTNAVFLWKHFFLFFFFFYGVVPAFIMEKYIIGCREYPRGMGYVGNCPHSLFLSAT